MNPVLAAVAVYLVYLAVVLTIWRAGKVDYLTLAESRASVRAGIVVPIGAGLVLLLIAVSVLGWWGDVLTQPRTGPAWALSAPVLFGLTALVGIVGFDWRAPGRDRLPIIALATLIVGVAEELLTRGVLVAGPQRAAWSFVGVFLLSTVLFSLLHTINGFVGVPWAAVPVQLVTTFLGGTVLFVTLFATGSLVVGMLLHALWDFATLGLAATGRTARPPYLALGVLTYVAGIAGVWAMIVA